MLKRWRIEHAAASAGTAVVVVDLDRRRLWQSVPIPDPDSRLVDDRDGNVVEFTGEFTLVGSLKPQTQLALGTWRHRLQPRVELEGKSGSAEGTSSSPRWLLIVVNRCLSWGHS